MFKKYNIHTGTDRHTSVHIFANKGLFLFTFPYILCTFQAIAIDIALNICFQVIRNHTLIYKIVKHIEKRLNLYILMFILDICFMLLYFHIGRKFNSLFSNKSINSKI